MTWNNRFRLLGGVLAVIALVLGLAMVFNHRQNQITSYEAKVAADSYTVGADYSGTVIKQLVKEGDAVTKGQPLFAVQSLQLKEAFANGLEIADTEVYKVDTDRGVLTYYAAADGRIDDLFAQQGNSVAVGNPLATLTGGERYLEASFHVVPRDYARLQAGNPARITLPNDQVITGTVEKVAVSSDSAGTVSTLRLKSSQLAALDPQPLSEPGTPVIVAVQLNDTGPLAPITDAMNDLLQQVGLR
ncbi:MAG TPA: HlyD family efflux transporter periplasmic adaptor subunit [Propionicimonas sp.]|nr:HlyD family efflux transporter periplasmic adaptor subunit [Propionicimonas sp.]HRA06833.1 HlyD family efflux transporter periplasmic adaptor subunit [Propionicimonas sp.]